MAFISALLDEGTRVTITNDRHTWYSDEPVSDDGTDQGPTPYELLMGSLAACTSLTLRLYARHKGIDLKWVRLRYQFDRVHAEDCEQCENDTLGLIERVQAHITVGGSFTDEQRARLTHIVGRCPVHKTLTNGMKIFEDVAFSDAPPDAGTIPAMTPSEA